MIIKREPITSIRLEEMIASEQAIDEQSEYYDRTDDHGQILDRIKELYGYGIKTQPDPADASRSIETYAKGDFDVQLNAGMIEAISTGFGNKVINARATLFTEAGQKFGLTHDSEGKDLRAAEKLLHGIRRAGGFLSALTKADRRSQQFGNAAIFQSFANNAIYYQALNPSCVRAYFADYINENGTRRYVDRTNINDATCVVIRMSQIDVTKWNYIAIFGRSDEYIDGRYVMYQASNILTEVPELGAENTVEWNVKDKLGNVIKTPANPLTYYGNQHPDLMIPEYPVTVIPGGITDGNTLMPTTDSLYQDCRNIDVAISHLLGTSQDAATGTKSITRDHAAAGKKLPPSVIGVVDWPQGMSLEHISHDAPASQIAMDVLKEIMLHLGAGWDVPDYMISSEDHMLEASSGVALAIKSRPLKKMRELRVKLMEPAVRDIFQIEKAMIDTFYAADDRSAAATLMECEQNWDAGELKLPENKKEKVEWITSLLNAGVVDIIWAIREIEQLADDEEAIEMYDTMRERFEKYSPLKEDDPIVPQKPVGLNRGKSNDAFGKKK